MRDLIVRQDASGAFADYTLESRDFQAKNFTLSTGPMDKIYIGLHKPFYRLWFELVTAPAASLTLGFRYLDGNAVEQNIDVTDETFSFTESGFVSWEREIDDWELNTIDGKEAYWITIREDAIIDSIVFRAINLIFSNDEDLTLESQLVDSRFKRSGELSFSPYAVSARNEIIQRFRNSGKTIEPLSNDLYELNQWDLLRPEQVRQASKYLTLAKIFFDVSSEVDDKYYQKYQDYMSDFAKAFDLYLLSYDQDDDGKEDDAEKRDRQITELEYL